MTPRIEPDLAIRAADGVALVGDLFVPAVTPAPCLVIRTPYGTPGLWPEAAALTGAGLSVLVQDVRGRHRSGGDFRLGADEGQDGAATIDWVTGRSWSDGRILLGGMGYEAFAAWCAAGHPAVRALASRQPWPSADVPALDDELWWRTELGSGRSVRPGLHDLITAVVPGLDADPSAPGFAESWPVPLDPWPPNPSTWKEAGRLVTRAVGAANIPSLHVGSWYCHSAETTLRHGRLSKDATVIMGGWASPLTHRLQPECALDVPDEPDAGDIVLTWLATLAQGQTWDQPERCLVLGEGWTVRNPLPPVGPRYRPVGPALKRMTLRHDPRQPCGSLPHSADLGDPLDRPDLVRLSFAGPLTWHGRARMTVKIDAFDLKEPVEVVATFVHARPDGVRTRITDASAPVPAGGGTVELNAAPTAVSLPAGHALHVELTIGRPPRRPAPPIPVELGVEIAPLLLPLPEDRP